jgi:hypothetical protein
MLGIVIRPGRALAVAAAAVTTVGVAATAMLPIGAAQAVAPALPSACSIDGYTPSVVILGTTTVTKTFKPLVSGCTVKSWKLTLGSGDATGILADTKIPTAVFGPRDFVNANAGAYGAAVQVQVDNPAEDRVNLNTYFFLLRRATWGPSFKAGPEPVVLGHKISITAELGRASWNSPRKPAYVGYTGRTVQVQFRAGDSSSWKTVKTVLTGKDGKVATTLTAMTSGSWRVHYAGNSVTSAADSAPDTVVVLE